MFSCLVAQAAAPFVKDLWESNDANMKFAFAMGNLKFFFASYPMLRIRFVQIRRKDVWDYARSRGGKTPTVKGWEVTIMLENGKKITFEELTKNRMKAQLIAQLHPRASLKEIEETLRKEGRKWTDGARIWINEVYCPCAYEIA